MAKDTKKGFSPIAQALAAVGTLAALAGVVLFFRTGKPDQPPPAEVESQVTTVEEPPQRQDAVLTPAPTQEVDVEEKREEVTAPPPAMPIKPELILPEKPEEMPAHVKGTYNGVEIYNNLIEVAGQPADPDLVLQYVEGKKTPRSISRSSDEIALASLASMEWQQGQELSYYDTAGNRISFDIGDGRFGYFDVALAERLLVLDESTGKIEVFQFPFDLSEYGVSLFWVEAMELPRAVGEKAQATTVVNEDVCEILRDEAGVLLDKFAPRNELEAAIEPLLARAPSDERVLAKAIEIVDMFPTVDEVGGRITRRGYAQRDDAIANIAERLSNTILTETNADTFLDRPKHYTAECSDALLENLAGYVGTPRKTREQIEEGHRTVTGEFTGDELANYPTRDDVKAKFAEVIAELLPSAEEVDNILGNLVGMIPSRADAEAMLETMAALHAERPPLTIKEVRQYLREQRVQNKEAIPAWEEAVLEAKAGYLAELQDWAVAIEELGYTEEAQTVRDEEIAPLRQELAGKGVELPSEPAKEKAKSTSPSESGEEEGIDEEQAMAGVRVHQLASADRASGLPQQQV